GGSYNQSWNGDVSPAFNGSIVGVQVGFPVLGLEHASGEKDRAGLFFGYATTTGNVTGFADGIQGAPVGALTINSYSVGAYWTHFWPAGGYLDGVLMHSWLTDNTNSVGNVSTANSGSLLTASLELGYPIPIAQNWAIEPQAQFIFQHWSEYLIRDSFSQISAVPSNVFAGRFGARLVGNLVTDKAILKPFALVNLWHDFGGQDQVAFDATLISTSQNVTAIEVGGGVS